jgi:hypothetical protein
MVSVFASTGLLSSKQVGQVGYLNNGEKMQGTKPKKCCPRDAASTLQVSVCVLMLEIRLFLLLLLDFASFMS